MLLPQVNLMGAAGRKAPQSDTDNSAVMAVNSRVEDIVIMVPDLSPRNVASTIVTTCIGGSVSSVGATVWIVPNPKIMWQVVGGDLAGKSPVDTPRCVTFEDASFMRCIAHHRPSHIAMLDHGRRCFHYHPMPVVRQRKITHPKNSCLHTMLLCRILLESMSEGRLERDRRTWWTQVTMRPLELDNHFI